MALDKLKIFQLHPVVPVVRAHNADDALWGCEQLINAGFGLLEITWTIPNAARVIEEITNNYPHITVGAGTMLSTQHMNEAHNAGAQWMVSPVCDATLLNHAQSLKTCLIPGALTPTELYTACMHGAPAIKVFPIGPMGGVSYLKSLLDPLGPMQLIPTGGIGVDEIASYLEAGALAVGVGGQLVSPSLLKQRDHSAIQAAAKSALFQQEKGLSQRIGKSTPASIS